MPENKPFLAKFAKRPSKTEAESNSGSTIPEKGTFITDVKHETTDDR